MGQPASRPAPRCGSEPGVGLLSGCHRLRRVGTCCVDRCDDTRVDSCSANDRCGHHG